MRFNVPERSSSLSATQSLIKATTAAPRSIRTRDKQLPKRPVAPATRTGRSRQNRAPRAARQSFFNFFHPVGLSLRVPAPCGGKPNNHAGGGEPLQRFFFQHETF